MQQAGVTDKHAYTRVLKHVCINMAVHLLHAHPPQTWPLIQFHSVSRNTFGVQGVGGSWFNKAEGPQAFIAQLTLPKPPQMKIHNREPKG